MIILVKSKGFVKSGLYKGNNTIQKMIMAIVSVETASS